MDGLKKNRITLVVAGVFIEALGIYLAIYSVYVNVTYPNGITLPELVFPYQLEGAILTAFGPTVFWFGIKYDKPIKGKKERLKKLFWWDWDDIQKEPAHPPFPEAQSANPQEEQQ